MAAVAAQVIARVAGRRGVLPALLTAGEVISDPGPDNDGPDAVAVVAILRPGEETRVGWVGDSRIYGYDGTRLRRYSTDQTVGEQLRRNGVPVEVASEHDNWLKASLAGATVGTVYTAYVPEEEMVVLCSDGVVDGLPDGRLEELVEQHAEEPQALADALVGEAEADEDGYRDDATVVVLRSRPGG
jgi:serine/threonine protein phosphatase PrpC